MPLNAEHPYSDDELRKIMGEHAEPIDEAEARELLDTHAEQVKLRGHLDNGAVYGERPRIYGLLWDNVQLVKISSTYYLDKYSMSALWISGTTFADLVQRA